MNQSNVSTGERACECSVYVQGGSGSWFEFSTDSQYQRFYNVIPSSALLRQSHHHASMLLGVPTGINASRFCEKYRYAGGLCCHLG